MYRCTQDNIDKWQNAATIVRVPVWTTISQSRVDGGLYRNSHIRPLIAAISSGVAIYMGVNPQYIIWEVRTEVGLLLFSDVYSSTTYRSHPKRDLLQSAMVHSAL